MSHPHPHPQQTPSLTCLKDLITMMITWLSDPNDYAQLHEWRHLAQHAFQSYDFTPSEQRFVNDMIRFCDEQYVIRIEKINEERKDMPSVEQLDALLQQKQTEQRTPEWYRQMSEIISASELGNLFAAPRQRAKMVMAKLEPPAPRNQSLAVFSGRMSAFDWGIRFEPVVKQIYIHRYGVELRELGRLHHPVDPRCTASPDGLVYSCPQQLRRGRLIEIKCPVTREINGTIPKEYYAQMQMQLQVTGLTRCDYIEAVFASPYNNMEVKEGPCTYSGYIILVRRAPSDSSHSQGEFYYAYSPIYANEKWRPVLEEEEEVVEVIPWRLMQWSEQLVMRNEDWWQSIQPAIQAFWEDVERAKRGEFSVPESTRASKKPKIEACRIIIPLQVNRLDENGNEIVAAQASSSSAQDE